MTSSHRRPEDTGRAGEGFFRMIATSAGLVVNQAHEDRAGWDFLVEAPNPLVIDFASHSRPQYRIQIKSTEGNLPSVSLSYSSLLSLIQHGGPAFVLLLRFGAGDAPDGAALLHIGEAESVEVLSALRRKQIAKPSVQVNKARHTLRFPPDIALTPLGGAGLRSRLESFVPRGYLSYLEEKTAWLQRLEADAQRLFANIQVEGETNVRAMAESFLGYDTTFHIWSKTYQAPMGIPGEDVEPSVEHPTEFRPAESELPKGTLTLRTTSYGAKYDFRATVYATPHGLPAVVRAMRFRTALFSIVIRLGEGRISFETADLGDQSVRASVKEFNSLLAFAAGISAVEAPTFELRLDSGAAPLSSELRLAPDALEGLGDLYAIFEPTYRRLSSLGLIDDHIVPATLFDMRAQIELLAYAGETFARPWEFEFEADAEYDALVTTVVFQVPVALASTEITFFVALTGTLSLVGSNRFKGSFTESEYLSEVSIPKTAQARRAEILSAHGDKLEGLLVARGVRVLTNRHE